MSVGSILSAIAPELEAALPMIGGPFGAIGAMAVKATAAILTPNDPNPTPEKLLAALPSATPEQLIALQTANNDFKLNVQKLGVDVIKIKADLEAAEAAGDVTDRVSARSTFGLVRFIPQMVMSTFFIGAYFAIEYMVMSGNIHVPDAYMATFNRITDTLLTLLILICNFWFGSTHGSQKKDDTLAQAASAQ